jgi:hypothetical protein
VTHCRVEDEQSTMERSTSRKDLHAVAEAVRDACLEAALDGYERAGLSGLCEAGRWEMVVDALRSLDVDAVVAQVSRKSAARKTMA